MDANHENQKNEVIELVRDALSRSCRNDISEQERVDCLMAVGGRGESLLLIIAALEKELAEVKAQIQELRRAEQPSKGRWQSGWHEAE